MKYVKEFATAADYTAYVATDFPRPNVSLCVAEGDLHYNPIPPPYSGFCKLTLENGSVVEIEGSGELTRAMISGYSATCVSAEVGTLCTSIASAFYDCTSLSSITMPNSITYIGNNAFYSCIRLTSITIPDSVTSIGNNAFRDCSAMTTCILGSSVRMIGTGVFESCRSLTNITIPSEVRSVGPDSFKNCSGLTSITVDTANTTFDSRNNCNAIIQTSTNTLIVGCKTTVIPNTVTSIGDNAFCYCTSLSSITIPDSVTNIGHVAFGYCSSLSAITSLATTAPTIQSDSFYRIKTSGTLYVPIGSSGYDTWTSRLGSNWTKVEQ